jgi:trehalose 6-phosphate synthase
MRRTVAENDVSHWASAFLDELSEKRPKHAKQVRPARRS